MAGEQARKEVSRSLTLSAEPYIRLLVHPSFYPPAPSRSPDFLLGLKKKKLIFPSLFVACLLSFPSGPSSCLSLPCRGGGGVYTVLPTVGSYG